MNTPTAKTFREPLLRSLGTATDLNAVAPVPMNDVLELVYTDSGIAEDAYGKDKNDWFKTRLWVQQAYKSLVKKDLAIKAGRGQWGLSVEGVKVAATLMGATVPAPTPAPPSGDDDLDLDALLDEMDAADPAPTFDPGTNDAPTEPQEAPVEPEESETASTPAPALAAAPVTTHEGGEGVAFALGLLVNTYNPDPYIRGLAIESTKCFGEFSGRSDICKACPLSGACQSSQLTRLSAVAAKLRKRDADAERAKNAPLTPAQPSEDIDDIIDRIEQEVEAPAAPQNEDIRKMKVPADGKCRECGGKIARGEQAIYVRTVGIYHEACHQK